MTRARRVDCRTHPRGYRSRLTIEALEDRTLMSVVSSAAPDTAERSAASSVTGRRIFYNASIYDNNTPGIDAADSSAIAPDKSAYLPGTGVIMPSSMTNYARGINGIFVDLTGQHGSLSLADFEFSMSGQDALADNQPDTWVAAPAPIGFTVLADTPTAGTDRVEFIWADGAIANRYLEVNVKGNDEAGGFNANTGLYASDVFYFGNKIGDTFVDTRPTHFTVTAADEIAIQAQIVSSALISSSWDMDRNGMHLASDRIVARANKISVLPRIDILSAGSVYLMHADGSGTFFSAATDTDEARGTAFRSAATTAVAGETVLLGPGTFNIDAAAAAIFVAAGITIKGAGIDVTTIESGMTDQLINKAILVLNDNVTLEDFTFHGTAVDAYQRPIGSDSGQSIHNAVLRRIKIYAPNASDALYDWALGTSSYYLYEVDFRTGFSVIKMLSSGGGDYLYAENSYFEVLGNNYAGPEDGLVFAAFNKSGTQIFKNSRFKVRNDGFRTSAALVWGQYNGVTILENTEFDVSATSGAVYDLDSQVSRDGSGSPQFFVTGGQGSGPNGEYLVSVEEDVTYLDPDGASATHNGSGSAVASALAMSTSPDRPDDRLPLASEPAHLEPSGDPFTILFQHIGQASESAPALWAIVHDAVDALELDNDLLEPLLRDSAP